MIYVVCPICEKEAENAFPDKDKKFIDDEVLQMDGRGKVQLICVDCSVLYYRPDLNVQF